MRQYCVYLTIYSGNKLPPFYIGSTKISKINRGYFGSVVSKEYGKIFKSEKDVNPHLFQVKIISTHYTREEAYIKENRLQVSLNVLYNSLYMNRAIALKTYSGVIFTESLRKKLSDLKKGKPLSQEHRDKLRGKHDEYHKEKISRSLRGLKKPFQRRKSYSSERKKNMSDALKLSYRRNLSLDCSCL